MELSRNRHLGTSLPRSRHRLRAGPSAVERKGERVVLLSDREPIYDSKHSSYASVRWCRLGDDNGASRRAISESRLHRAGVLGTRTRASDFPRSVSQPADFSSRSGAGWQHRAGTDGNCPARVRTGLAIAFEEIAATRRERVTKHGDLARLRFRRALVGGRQTVVSRATNEKAATIHSPKRFQGSASQLGLEGRRHVEARRISSIRRRYYHLGVRWPQRPLRISEALPADEAGLGSFRKENAARGDRFEMDAATTQAQTGALQAIGHCARTRTSPIIQVAAAS
jgi:hypothetical protein